MSIMYLAVDKSFPYHLNVFNDIPVNYSSGNLVNITGNQWGERYYKNVINYPTLAGSIGSNYLSFGSNLAKNDVALFLCAIYNLGNKTAGLEVKYTVKTQILTTTTFEILVTAAPNYILDLLKFSIVAFDKQDVERSGKFAIVFYYISLPGTSDQYISIPKEFVQNTLIGLLDYKTINAKQGLEFNWQFDLANDRIKFNKSVPHSGSSAQGGLIGYTISVFYMKTWVCPTTIQIYFNLETNMCDDYCNKYLHANQTAKQCQLCQFGCYECINGPASGCSSCNPLDFRVMVAGKCECQAGYYQNPSGATVCVTCGTLLANCATCQKSILNAFQCLTCSPGYAFTGTACTPCAIPFCQVAVASAGTCSCTQCLSGFALDSSTCTTCSTFIPNCISCSSSTVCTACDTANQFYLTPSAGQCITCSIEGCTKCKSLTTCETCNTANDYFMTANESCSKCALEGCDDCASLTVCNVCNEPADYFMNSSIQCEKCSLQSCTNCDSLDTCLACDQGQNFFLDENQCLKCNLQGCLQCSSLTECAVIDPNYNREQQIISECNGTCLCNGYTFPQYMNETDDVVYCSTQCGDGLKRNFEQCDDGNLIDGDGCSSACLIETAWKCTSNSSSTCCSLQNTTLNLSIKKITKVNNKNSLALELEISPTLRILTTQNLQKFVTLTVSSVPLFNESRNVLPNQIMEVTYDYNESIHGKKGHIAFEISFSQPSAPSCVIRAEKNLTIMAQANNNLPFMFYTQDELQKQEDSAQSAKNLEIAAFVIFFLSLIPAKINGLELMGVLQLAYFSLAQQQNINALLEPFMTMNEVNGFNPAFLTESGQTLPDQVSSLGIKALFLNNCNIMLLLILTEILVAGVLMAVAHFASSVSKKVSSVAKHLIKEGLLTLMMFNALNIAFGVGVHFHYADSSADSYVLSSVAAVLAVCLLFTPCILLMTTASKQFGEFKDKLKPDLMCQLYFVFSLVYRFVLGFYIAVKAEYVMSSLMVMGFSMLFLLYNLVNLPFRQAYQNYRANLVHVSQLTTLLVANYYDSMLETETLEKKAYRFTAAEIEIGCIFICVGFSAICLAYDGFMFIKNRYETIVLRD